MHKPKKEADHGGKTLGIVQCRGATGGILFAGRSPAAGAEHGGAVGLPTSGAGRHLSYCGAPPPLGFSDALFETAVRRGEISYEAGAIISKNAMLTAGWADYVQLADSPYRRRFAPLISAGVRLGCLICVDTDGHLEKIPPQTCALLLRCPSGA